MATDTVTSYSAPPAWSSATVEGDLLTQEPRQRSKLYGDRAYDDFQVPVASASLKHKLHEDSKRQLRRKVLNSVINEMNKHDQLHYRAQIEEPVRLTLHYERVGEETSIELESEFGQKSQRIFTDSDLYDFGAESIFYSWLENTLKTFI